MGEIGSGTGTSYPGALDTESTLEVNSPSASKTRARAEVINDLAAAVVALQTELGIDPAGTLTDVKTFLQKEHNTDGTHVGTVNVETYASFSAAVSSIGSTEKTLIINTNQTVSTAVTVPSTLHIVVRGTGKFTKSGSGTLTINGPFEAPLKQVFVGFAAGDVTFGVGSHPAISPVWFGAVGDGVTDSRPAIAVAVRSLPSTGGVIQFPRGVFVTNSASALLSVTDKNGVWIRGVNAGATTLKNNGTGNGIELLGTTEIVNVRVSSLDLQGNNTGAKGIDLQNAKDWTVSEMNINGWLNHGIDVRGAFNLNGVISKTRFVGGVGALASGRAINIRTGGGQNRSEHNYFDIGGNPAAGGDRYDTAVDVRDGASFTSIGDIFEGATYGIQTNQSLVVVDPYFNFTSPAPAALSFGVYPQANNQITIIGGRAGDLTKLINNPSNTVSDKYISLIGINDGEHGQIGGTLIGAVLTPAQITANQNDYNPGSRYTFLWRLSADATGRVITGIAARASGHTLVISNVGGNSFTLAYNSVSSAFANRIFTGIGRDLVIPADASVVLVYDGSVQKWRVVSSGNTFPVVLTADLPAGGASQDGTILIEDAGAGDKNLIIYSGGQRFRLDGGAAF